MNEPPTTHVPDCERTDDRHESAVGERDTPSPNPSYPLVTVHIDPAPPLTPLLQQALARLIADHHNPPR